MFGFLTGPPKSREYRQAYARCCSMQRSQFGYRSLAFVSYEAVFLYCVGVDLQLIDSPRSDDPTCCRTRGQRLHNWKKDERRAAEFTSQFAMLLAKTKLDDDVKDAHSFLALSIRFLLRRQIKRMDRYFRERELDFHGELEAFFREHENLENESRHHRIEDYVQPTAGAFGLLFQTFARQLGARTHERLFQQLGHCVGAAVIGYDCAVDWQRDRKRGHYNPLRSTSEVAGALDHCTRQLVQAGWLLSDAIGEQGIAAAVLRHRITTISSERVQVVSQRPAQVTSTARRRGVFQLKTGDCDCFCPADGCDLGHCCNPCDGGHNCDSGPSCDCCHCCDCWCDNNDNRNQKGKQNAVSESTYTDLIGAAGEAKTPLAPYGTVLVGGQEHPAKAQHELIEQGQRVVVVGKDTFGLVVQLAKRP